MVDENEALRRDLDVKMIELQNALEIRVRSNGKVVYSEEFIRDLEARSNLLSRENDILLLNLERTREELEKFDFEFRDKLNEYTDKTENLNFTYKDLETYKERFREEHSKNTILEREFSKINERFAEYEIENEGLRNENQQLRLANEELRDSMMFYKKFAVSYDA